MWEVVQSLTGPLAMVFTNVAHSLNVAAANNSFLRTECQCFFLDSTIKGLAHVHPLGTDVSNARPPNAIVKNEIYMSLYEVANANLLYSEIYRRASE